MNRKLPIAALCILNFAIAIAYLSPLRHRPLWDLPQFYFAGRLVMAGDAHALYDKTAYTGLIQELRQSDARASRQNVYFNRPAFGALLCVPLAFFSFATLKPLVIAANLLLLALLVWKLPLWLSAPPGTRALLFVFLPFLYSLALGQDTLLMTLMLALALSLLLRGQEVPAGVLLALAALKPHLIVAVPLVILAGKRWKALWAFLATGAFLALASLAMVGTQGIKQWLDLLQAPTTDYAPMLMGNLRALGLHLGWFTAVAATAAALICFVVILKGKRTADQFSAAILIGLLLSPHTYCQDYSLLAIVALVSLHPVARYLVLVPWPYFCPPDHLLPWIAVALACLVGLAARSWHWNSPSDSPGAAWASNCKLHSVDTAT